MSLHFGQTNNSDAGLDIKGSQIGCGIVIESQGKLSYLLLSLTTVCVIKYTRLDLTKAVQPCLV